MKLLAPLAFIAALLAMQQDAQAQRSSQPPEFCGMRVSVGLFPTDGCPWDDAPFREAMEVAEAARWRCPAFDAFTEEKLVWMLRAAEISVKEERVAEILARDCSDPGIMASFGAVQALIDAVLFVHLSAGLDLYDGGLERLVVEERRRFLPELRAERARLAALDLGFEDLPERASRLAELARAGDQARRTALWSHIIGWTAPLFQEEQGLSHARLNRHGVWIGYRPILTLRETAVASKAMRLSSEGYPPGAAYASRTDAVNVLTHIGRAGRPEDATLHFDVGYEPRWHGDGRELVPAAAILRLGEEEWRAEQTGEAPPPPETPRRATHRFRETLHRFVFGGETVAAMLAAGNEAELDFEILFRDEDGDMVSSDDILEAGSGECGRNCRPSLRLGGFADTYRWANGGVDG